MGSRSRPSFAIDTYINQARREKQTVTIYLVDGTLLTGRISGFDEHSIVLNANRRHLIYKHAITAIGIPKHSESGINLAKIEEAT